MTAAEIGWDRLENGRLLKAAEDDGFELVLTTDKQIRYQQNLKGRRIALVVLGNQNWKVARFHVEKIVAAVNASMAGGYVEVEIPFG